MGVLDMCREAGALAERKGFEPLIRL
jgi:hypothetical protein